MKMNQLGKIAFLLALSAVAVTVKARIIPFEATVDHPSYAFKYAVHDPLTKDNKAQWEIRDGDAVKGSYSLTEPDGSLRVVDYSANDLTGFNAVVKRYGPNIHHNLLITKVPLPVHSIQPTRLLTKVSAPAHSNVPVPQHIVPLNYNFGVAPVAIGAPKAASTGKWSLPWDSLTGSYGGWVPMALKGPHATIFSKKYINGKLHTRVKGPILISGKRIILKSKH